MTQVSKIALTAGIAFFFTLVAFNNVVDYRTNYEFVEHVLSMDTLHADSPIRSRALTDPALHRAFYAAIIGWQGMTALLCWAGALRLALLLRADAARFHASKGLAVAGLLLGCLLWLLAFLCVGGEWFAMWQSPNWNGQTAAFRMFTVNGIVLILVQQPEVSPTR